MRACCRCQKTLLTVLLFGPEYWKDSPWINITLAIFKNNIHRRNFFLVRLAANLKVCWLILSCLYERIFFSDRSGSQANLKIDWFFFRFIWYLLRYLQKKIAEKYRFRYLFLTHAFFRLGSNGGYGNNNNNYGGKKKSKKMSTLKKAAVLGAVAYGSYQIGKMSSGYGGWNNHPRG